MLKKIKSIALLILSGLAITAIFILTIFNEEKRQKLKGRLKNPNEENDNNRADDIDNNINNLLGE